jgi:hypothetical protein
LSATGLRWLGRDVGEMASATVAGMLAISALESGVTPASAHVGDVYQVMGNPALTGEGLPFPAHLTRQEYENLNTFDEADFVVFSNQEWDRFSESHAPDVRVHWPDGHFTDGLEPHIEDLKWLFVWAPNLKITSHPVRVAKGNLVSAVGVFKGTFSRPMPDGKGGLIPPTGKSFAMSMVTVGIFNRRGTMDEEFLFYDNLAFNQQLGLA